MKNNTTLFGYDSITDFLNTNLGFSTIKWNSLGAAAAALSTFVTGYVYDTAEAVYFMLFALLIDGITGVWVALKNGKFSSARLPRILLTMVFYCLLLALGWNAAKHNVIFSFLPAIIYGGLMTTILVSIFENVYYLGYLPKSIFNILKQRLKLNKLLESDNNKSDTNDK